MEKRRRLQDDVERRDDAPSSAHWLIRRIGEERTGIESKGRRRRAGMRMGKVKERRRKEKEGENRRNKRDGPDESERRNWTQDSLFSPIRL